MRKYLLIVLIILGLQVLLPAQVVVFHENFELPSLDDSVGYDSYPTAGLTWNINTRLHAGTNSLRSDSCQVQNAQTVNLVTQTFSTVGNTFVILTFDQICKIDFLDIATIEVSNDGGITWTTLTGTHYQGIGQYAGNGNRFAANSYGNAWQPSISQAVPTNIWWRSETFDISPLVANTPNARVRFRLTDGGPPGAGNNKGWFIDNIKIVMAPSELTPPVITLIPPVITGIVWSVGPFVIKAKVTDISGIDTTYLVYNVNNGPNDTVGMVHIGSDTMIGAIPTVNDSDQVCWWVEAYDASPAHNWARQPVSTCNQFTAYAGITFPFYDNFDVNLNLWTPSYGGTNQQSTWQLGSPNFGVTNSTHSPPNAWDVNLSTAYQNNAYCILTSPVFDFSNAVNARMEFWINYKTESSWDGTRIEYTTNGTTWQTLGVVNDPLGTNWYSGILNATNQPGWGGNSNGWKKCKYKLSALNNMVGQVRFRYMFNADGGGFVDGFSLDDFSITLPSPLEASAEKLVMTTTGCGLGNETVKIKIFNSGLTPITSGLTAGYKKSPSSPAVIETVPNTILPGDTLTYTFATPVNLQAVNADSNFVIKGWIHLIGDPNLGDDTTFKQVLSKYVPAPPGVTNANINYGTFTTLTATSVAPITWYSAPSGGSILGTGPTFTTPILYGTTIYYPGATAPNGCVGPRANDTVFVGQAPPFDGSTLDLVSPVTGFNLTNAMVVRSLIRNYGTAPMSGFPISYKLNNQAPVTETFTNTLQPGDTITYVFTTPANLSAYQSHVIKAWLDVPGDQNHLNDTVTETIVNNPYTYCISKANNNWDDDIGNVTVSNLNNGNASPIFNNPSATGDYTDYTNLPPILLTKGQSYPISVTAIYSAGHYSACCKVFVDWNYDGQFDAATETAFSAGPTTTANTVLTGSIDVPLTAALGYTRFRVVLMETTMPSSVLPCGSYGYGETEDYAAFIMPQLPYDAGVISIQSPAQTYPQGYINPVTVTIKNFGTEPITSVDVAYKLDNDPPVSQTWTGNLLPNTTTQVSFPAITWPNGFHQFCAYTVLVNDSNAFNDTLCRTIQGVPVDSLPYYDFFDGAVNFFPTSPGGGTSWINGAPVPPNWPAPAYSQPNVWATNLNMTGYTANANCYLTTQIFDFTNAINAKISFQYKCDIPTYGDGVQLQYSLNGGTTWNPLGVQNDPLGINWYNYNVYNFGAAWAGSTTGWKKATYLLSNFNQLPTMRFRFVFFADGYTQQKGFAIDNFSITIPYPLDAGVDSILLPQGQAVAGTQLYPQVRLVNFSSTNLSTVDIKYFIDGGPTLTHTWNGSLVPGAATTVNLSLPYSAPQGNYKLTVYADLAGDGDHVNDTTKITLFGIPTFTIPYTDLFDSTLTYWYTTGSQWQHGTPNSILINTPFSPPYCWKTKLNSIYVRTGQTEYLYSPMFDFTNTGYDSLILQHWAHIFQYDGGRIEYLSTSGWVTLGYMGDPFAINWYTNNVTGWSGTGVPPGWHKSAYDLKTISNFATPTQFRFTFSVIYENSAWDGWAIDNFTLTSPKIPKDAGVTDIVQPVNQSIYGSSLDVTVSIRNFGTDTLYSVPIKYQVDGTTVNIGNWTGTLYPDSSALFTFNPIDSPLADYILCAFTDLPSDDNYNNDTTCKYITVLAPDYDLLVSRIVTPVELTIHGDSAEVSIVVKNVGQFPATDIPVGYIIADSMILVQEFFQPNPPIASGDSAFYTFATRYSYEYLGYYYLCAFTNYLSDGYHANDTTCKRLEELYTLIPENEQDAFYLSQNIPNPTDDLTQIVMRLPKAGQVKLEVVNLVGQKVWARDGKMSEGEHVISLDTRAFPAGVYYYFLQFDQQRLVRKMVVSH